MGNGYHDSVSDAEALLDHADELEGFLIVGQDGEQLRATSGVNDPEQADPMRACVSLPSPAIAGATLRYYFQ